MAGMTLHWSALPEGVESALREVSAALSGSDFYLAGGTALALHLGHRLSRDIDLFSPSFSVPEPLAADLTRRLPELRVSLVAPRTLYAELRGVQTSFFGYDFPLLEPPVAPELGTVAVAGVADIAAMKLAAIASRGSRKDFVDLWCLVRTGRALRELLGLYSRKFRAHDIGHVVRSLTYFDEADQEPPLRLLLDAPWERVKGDFGRWVGELLASD